LLNYIYAARKEGPHYQERVKLTSRIKAIKKETATLEKRLPEIKRGL
jgi:hypothetical protein